MPSIYKVGTTILNFAEKEYLYAAVGRGYTRNQVRAGFRTLFNKGFSQGTFTQVRRSFQAGEILANRLNQSIAERTTTITPQNIRPIRQEYRLYEINGSFSASNALGDSNTFPVRFYTRDISVEDVQARIEEIAQRVNDNPGSDWRLLNTKVSNVLGVNDLSLAQTY